MQNIHKIFHLPAYVFLADGETPSTSPGAIEKQVIMPADTGEEDAKQNVVAKNPGTALLEAQLNLFKAGLGTIDASIQDPSRDKTKDIQLFESLLDKMYKLIPDALEYASQENKTEMFAILDALIIGAEKAGLEKAPQDYLRQQIDKLRKYIEDPKKNAIPQCDPYKEYMAPKPKQAPSPSKTPDFPRGMPRKPNEKFEKLDNKTRYDIKTAGSDEVVTAIQRTFNISGDRAAALISQAYQKLAQEQGKHLDGSLTMTLRELAKKVDQLK